MIFRNVTKRALYTVVVFAGGCSFGGSTEPLQRAEELSREGRYDEAVIAYREHMNGRLAVQNRPQWENPYFYLLIIGDMQLGQGHVDDALSEYEEAERRGVHETLVSDRYRSVATWYEEHGDLEKALEILKKYRDRDSLLFDSMLDRIGRQLSDQENKLPPK